VLGGPQRRYGRAPCCGLIDEAVLMRPTALGGGA
jgi:hypothetical protein